MPGKPFQSKLEDFYDFIVQKRRARKTWQEITDLLKKEHKVETTRQNVYDFFKRKRKRRYATGMEPEASPVSPVTKAPVLPAFPTAEPDRYSIDDEPKPSSYFSIITPNQNTKDQ
jgi:hypothetical protein